MRSLLAVLPLLHAIDKLLCYNCYKIRAATNTAFLISKTVVPNLCSHVTAFDPQSFAPLY